MLKKNIDSHSLKFFMRIHFMSQHFYHTKHVNHERSNEINLKGGKRTSAKSYEREELAEYENMLSVLSDLLMGDDIVKLQGYRWKKNGVEFKIDSCSDEKIVVQVLNQRAIARSRGN